MFEFGKFWWGCFLEGWHVFDGIFGIIEGLCALIGAGLYWDSKFPILKKHREKWKGLEPRIMKWAFVISISSFLISTILVAPFHLNKETDGKLVSEMDLSENLRKQIADKSPVLEGFVHRFMAADESGTTNSLIFLDVSISNSGGSPSYAETYDLCVILSTNRSATAEEIEFADEYKLPFTHKNKPWQIDLKRRQLIAEKTTKAIAGGDHYRGWLAYRLHGLKIAQYTQTNIIFSFADINGKRIYTTNGFWKGKLTRIQTNVDSLTMVIPGAENIFYPIQPEVRTNWLPPELPPGCSNVTVCFGSQSFNYPRQIAEISGGTNGKEFAIKDLPDYFLKDLDTSPSYSPRQRNVWLRQSSMNMTIGGKTFPYPIQPVIISNRLYVEVEVPFSDEKRNLVMSDAFDQDLHIPRKWDRNYSTNYDEFGNGVYFYEVVNELTNPVLQIAYAAPNVVVVDGIFKVDSNSIYAAFGQPPALLSFSNSFIYGLQTTQRITTISLQSQTFNEVIAFRTNDSIAQIGEVWTNEFYRPIFQYQRRVFKYPSSLNLGNFEDWDSTNKRVTQIPEKP